MAAQAWDPDRYARDAGFVSELGGAVVEMLGPRRGERILDLGCGDGRLTRRLVEAGCEVVGVDSSPEMVEAAIERGIDARLMQATELDFRDEFDAVFSNAALHWMPRPDEVIVRVRGALRKGGRFVGEFGGHGNVSAISKALRGALESRGVSFEALNPWYFPTADEYCARLEGVSMTVRECRLFPRPTPMEADLIPWLETFAGPFLGAVPVGERVAFLQEVSARCESELKSEGGHWVVDYVRLRFAAFKG